MVVIFTASFGKSRKVPGETALRYGFLIPTFRGMMNLSSNEATLFLI